MEFIVSLNLHRRQLTQSQKATVYLDMAPMLEAEAKEGQRKGGGDHGNQHTGGKLAVTPSLGEPLDRPKAGETNRKAAAILGVAHGSISEIKRINRVAPERIEEIRHGKNTIGRVITELKRDGIIETVEREKGKEVKPARPMEPLIKPDY